MALMALMALKSIQKNCQKKATQETLAQKEDITTDLKEI
jgi:hypothetical protein